jgi:superfamily II DNA/RNA helicase
MLLEHEGFRKVMKKETYAKDILAVIIDESHCISQWGGEFRPHYAKLTKLRDLFPVGTPLLAASATLNKTALRDVRDVLSIDAEECFHLNLGNDRPNIYTSVHWIKGSDDTGAIKAHLNLGVKHAKDHEKTVIFVNTVKLTQDLAEELKADCNEELGNAIGFLHSHRSAGDKKKVMRDFAEGKIRILVATEAAGMVRTVFDSVCLQRVEQPYVGRRHSRHPACHPVRHSQIPLCVQTACRSCRSFCLHQGSRCTSCRGEHEANSKETEEKIEKESRGSGR